MPKLVAKLVLLGISFLTSFILALRVVLVAKLVILGILSSLSFYLSIIYKYFLTTAYFTTSLNSLKSTGTGTNQHLVYLLYFSNCLKQLLHFSLFVNI